MTIPYTNPSASKRVAVALEDRAGEDVERPLAHVGDEVARFGRPEQIQGRALGAGVAERVVDVVEARIGRLGRAELAQQPELLVVADVREVPRERRHQRRVLRDEQRIGDRVEQRERASSGCGQLAADPVVQLRHGRRLLYQPRAIHSSRWGRSVPIVVSSP